ncbi:DUF2345 domain-containing protein [Enterobacter roggenkampii]|nr:DUF2345 domain-containing protein [Enterobacter roggenkampii]
MKYQSPSLYETLTGNFTGDLPLEVVNEEYQVILSVLDNIQRILNARAGTVSHLPDYGLPDMTKILQGMPGTATTPMDATVSVRNDAVTTGEHYRYAAPYRDAGDDTSPEPETESGAFYARIDHERELNKSARIHLFSNAAHLTPGQLSLKSGEGPIEVQAQNASLRLFAEQKLTLSSASDISFAGKKRITLIGGGSYLRLEAGKVEYGTTAMYMRKVKRTMAAGSSTLGQGTAEMPAPLPNLSCGPNTACFRVLDSLTGSEDMEFAYQLQTSTGTVVGRTDSALTHAINSDTEKNVNLDYVFQIRAGTR